MKQETVLILDEFIETANKFVLMAKEVKEGASEAEVCTKYNIDRSKFRRLVRSNWYTNPEETYTGENCKYFSWIDMFLDDLVGRYTIELHENFEENYHKAVRHLDERTRFVIDKYYREGWTLTEIGEKLELSNERVRQLKTKGINQLKHPNMLSIFTTGSMQAMV